MRLFQNAINLLVLSNAINMKLIRLILFTLNLIMIQTFNTYRLLTDAMELCAMMIHNVDLADAIKIYANNNAVQI